MNVKTPILWGFIAISIALYACSQSGNRGAGDESINSSATLRSTNDTVRVNQAQAFERNNGIVASGTNLKMVEAAGAGKSAADDGLATQVKTAIQTDPTLAPLANSIHISAKDGKVILTGTVKSDAEKQTIFEKARSIAGEDKVDNNLQVLNTPDLPPNPTEPKPANP